MVKKTGNFLITKLKTPCPNRWNAELNFPNIQKTAIIRVHKWLLIWNIFYQRILTAVWTPNIASHWMILFENVSIERKKLIEAIASYFQLLVTKTTFLKNISTYFLQAETTSHYIENMKLFWLLPLSVLPFYTYIFP